MSEQDKFNIHVQINGIRLPLTISRSDEEIYRKAEKLVTTNLNRLQEIYRNRAYEEVLVILAYNLAVALAKQELTNDTAPMADWLQGIDDELKELLGL